MTARTVVALRGGMGNQMFQYAAGRMVAERTGAPLLLDATLITIEPDRFYMLDALGVETEVSVEPAIDPLAVLASEEAQATYAREHFGADLIAEHGHEFADEFAAAAPASMLYGYWQSERYFDEIAEAIRAELTPKALSERAAAQAEAISASRSPVAVHVRRGDYAADPEKRSNHGLIGPGYYFAASEAVANRVVDPEFFVFSDDPEWCAAELRLAGPMTVVSGATGPVDDLGLMALCRHFVIANSSFSWWGAWLGERRGSVVVAPAKWFDAMQLDASDIVPPRWLKL